MKATDILSNGTLRLRAPELGDLDFLYSLENNPSLWLASANVLPYSRYQLERYIRESAHDIYTDRQIRFVIERISDKVPVGCIDLTDIDPYNAKAEVGVGVLPEYRRSGYASGAFDILKSYCDNFLHLNQIFGFVSVHNEECVNLFINKGFTQSGLLKEWIRGEESYQDVAVMQFFFEKKTLNRLRE